MPLTEVRIREKATDRVWVGPWSLDCDPEDGVLLGQILTREVREGHVPYEKRDLVIEAWHPRKGWIEHPG